MNEKSLNRDSMQNEWGQIERIKRGRKRKQMELKEECDSKFKWSEWRKPEWRYNE